MNFLSNFYYLSNKTTSSQCKVWGNISTGTATTGVNGSTSTSSDGLIKLQKQTHVVILTQYTVDVSSNFTLWTCCFIWKIIKIREKIHLCLISPH
jgi:hypothetical protein